VEVGDEIAKYLEANGIGVYHDTAYNDYPEFDGAYERSLAAIQNDMKKYPSIKVVLDIHRDSIQNDDGTRIKPTVVIGGKKAAQVMIISACGEPGSSMTVPNWQWNYRFALRIEQQLNKTYPGLARPIELVDKQYNQQVSHGALLIDFGTDVNTLDEATYSGELFGQSLAKVLKSLQG
jgi:stage II sporulation protein P